MAVRAAGTCLGFDATMTATEPRCYVAGSSITAPVTVAFGARDFLLLPNQSRHLDELPPRQTAAREIPRLPRSAEPAARIAVRRDTAFRYA
jgi:hypothetical protein